MAITSHILLLLAVFTGLDTARARNIPAIREKKLKCSPDVQISCNYAACYNSPSLPWNLTQSSVELEKRNVQLYGFQADSTCLTQGDCCWKCATTAGCKYWIWQPESPWPCQLSVNDDPAYLKCGSPSKPHFPIIGGSCDPKLSSDSKPTTASSSTVAPYNFPVDSGSSVCLLTNDAFHVNGKMDGYWTESKENEFRGQNFVEELGIIWMMDDEIHRAKFVAAKGLLQSEATLGLLADVEVDGLQMNLPKLDEVVHGSGKLTVRRNREWGGEPSSNSASVGMAPELYTIDIDGIMNIDVVLQSATPLYRTESDSFIHFNVIVNEIQGDQSVNGLLGPFYQYVQKFGNNLELAPGSLPDVEPLSNDKSPESIKKYVSSSLLEGNCPVSTFRKPASKLETVLSL